MERFEPHLDFIDGAAPTIGEQLLDEYLRFTAARLRPNSVLAQAFDIKVFFEVVGKAPLAVTTADVLAFIEQQRAPRHGGNVVRLADGEQGLAASTIKRRLATVSSVSTIWSRGGCVSGNRSRGRCRRGPALCGARR